MTVEEIFTAAQTLTFEERKELIHRLFTQMPKSSGLAGTITEVWDLETGRQTIRAMAQESLKQTAQQFQTDIEELD